MSELKANVKAISEKLLADYEFDANKGRVSFKDADKKISDFLPEGVTLDMVKEVQGFLIDATSGIALATGEVGLKELKTNKDLEAISSNVKFGHSAMNANFRKRKSGVADGKEWVKWGATSARLEIGVGRAARPFKDVEEHLAKQAESVFSN